jgi:hypothetical protein
MLLEKLDFISPEAPPEPRKSGKIIGTPRDI